MVMYQKYLYITYTIIVNFHQFIRYSMIYLPVIFCELWLSGLFFLLAALAASPPLWSTEALFLYLPCFVALLLDLSELLLFWTLTSSSTISSCINNKQFSNVSPPSCSSEDTGLSPGRVFIFVSSCSVVSKGMIEICCWWNVFVLRCGVVVVYHCWLSYQMWQNAGIVCVYILVQIMIISLKCDESNYIEYSYFTSVIFYASIPVKNQNSRHQLV